ncbi:MAG: CpaF family protein [Lachnospiraceae bacterium]|nr:CpaF family protein [Lachnospiraceae bacterium]
MKDVGADNDYERLRESIRESLLEKLDRQLEMPDEKVMEMIREEILYHSRGSYLSLSQKEKLRKELFFGIRKLDILQELVEDPTVTEIMVNGPDHIFIERQGALTKYPEQFVSREKLEDVIAQIVAGCNRVVNERNPIVDARLSNGSRVNVVLPPVALNGPILTIRRFPEHPITMEQLLMFGSITGEAADFLKQLVIAGYNIFISGGTGSGKTTFLNVLSGFIPKTERIITIEDSAELQIQGVENLVRLETRNANLEDMIPITIRDLIRSSLRMRPDRIIVGEVRGAEALDMLQAMNTGHDGSLSTAHANSAADMISRLETMVILGSGELPISAIRRQISSGIDILVHLGRLRDRSRRVLSIHEMDTDEQGEIALRTLFAFEETGEDAEKRILGALVKKAELKYTAKLQLAGLLQAEDRDGLRNIQAEQD